MQQFELSKKLDSTEMPSNSSPLHGSTYFRDSNFIQILTFFNPISRGLQSLDGAGMGTEKPSELSKDDDEFDAYRKRMMLAYRFRPNPLVGSACCSSKLRPHFLKVFGSKRSTSCLHASLVS